MGPAAFVVHHVELVVKKGDGAKGSAKAIQCEVAQRARKVVEDDLGKILAEEVQSRKWVAPPLVPGHVKAAWEVR